MKHSIQIATFLSILLLVACKQNEPETSAYSACMQTESPSQEAIFTIIQGKWKLTERYCGNCNTPNLNTATNYAYTLIFKPDSMVEMTSDDILFPSQKFEIVKSSNTPKRYSIKINDPAGAYIMHGFFFTCGDKIGFTSAYVDGTTDIYTKQPN